MDVADRLELHELPGRYGDAIDDRNWEGLGKIFTEDAVFDLTDLGGPRLEGLDHIRRYMDTEAQHPRTHMMTNIYVDDDADAVRMYFRIVAYLKDRSPATASYYDEVVKTPEGWRVKDRLITARRRPLPGSAPGATSGGAGG
jgi:3-phenylpropionate/cinnamic acid dioxygenase small subunit